MTGHWTAPGQATGQTWEHGTAEASRAVPGKSVMLVNAIRRPCFPSKCGYRNNDKKDISISRIEGCEWLWLEWLSILVEWISSVGNEVKGVEGGGTACEINVQKKQHYIQASDEGAVMIFLQREKTTAGLRSIENENKRGKGKCCCRGIARA